MMGDVRAENAQHKLYPMTDPWSWYIYLSVPIQINHSCSSIFFRPMDPSWVYAS